MRWKAEKRIGRSGNGEFVRNCASLRRISPVSPRRIEKGTVNAVPFKNRVMKLLAGYFSANAACARAPFMRFSNAGTPSATASTSEVAITSLR